MRSIIAQIHLSQTISLIFTFQKKKKRKNKRILLTSSRTLIFTFLV